MERTTVARKRLYIPPELASQFEKSGGAALQRQVNLRIDIKPLIGHARLMAGKHGKLGEAEQSMLYSGVFCGPVALGEGRGLTRQNYGGLTSHKTELATIKSDTWGLQKL